MDTTIETGLYVLPVPARIDVNLLTLAAEYVAPMACRALRIDTSLEELHRQNPQIEMSQKQLAEVAYPTRGKAAHVPKHFSDWKHDRNTLSAPRLKEVAQKLDVHPGWLERGEMGVYPNLQCPDWLLPYVALYSRVIRLILLVDAALDRPRRLTPKMVVGMTDEQIEAAQHPVSRPTLAHPAEDWVSILSVVGNLPLLERSWTDEELPWFRELYDTGFRNTLYATPRVSLALLRQRFTAELASARKMLSVEAPKLASKPRPPVTRTRQERELLKQFKNRNRRKPKA